MTYYNEWEPYPAAWTRALIADGQIPAGEVDERSIEDVRADDVRHFRQWALFNGVSGWPIALRLARWPDDREILTASPPCQPFSKAGKGAGFDDSRDLWPHAFRLIRDLRPEVAMGEQVDGPAGNLWIDRTRTDLEGIGYAFGAAILPACSVNAPTRRYRYFWIASRTERGRKALERIAGERRGEGRTRDGLRGWRDAATGGSGGRGAELERCAIAGWRPDGEPAEALPGPGEIERSAGRSGTDRGALAHGECAGNAHDGCRNAAEATGGVQGADGQRERIRPDAGQSGNVGRGGAMAHCFGAGPRERCLAEVERGDLRHEGEASGPNRDGNGGGRALAEREGESQGLPGLARPRPDGGSGFWDDFAWAIGPDRDKRTGRLKARRVPWVPESGVRSIFTRVQFEAFGLRSNSIAKEEEGEVDGTTSPAERSQAVPMVRHYDAAEEICEGSGVESAVQAQEVLLSIVRQLKGRGTARSVSVPCSAPAWVFLQQVRRYGKVAHTPRGRELSKQLAEQPGNVVCQLPPAWSLADLDASEGASLQILRAAWPDGWDVQTSLREIQGAWRDLDNCLKVRISEALDRAQEKLGSKPVVIPAGAPELRAILLGQGEARRADKIRGYGNSINPELAAVVVRAYMEAENDSMGRE